MQGKKKNPNRDTQQLSLLFFRQAFDEIGSGIQPAALEQLDGALVAGGGQLWLHGQLAQHLSLIHILLDCANPRTLASIENVGGLEAYQNSCENVWAIIDKLAPTGKLPRLMFACGTEDAMIYENLKTFRKHCGEIGLDCHWFIKEGYRHEWRFWDQMCIRDSPKAYPRR